MACSMAGMKPMPPSPLRESSRFRPSIVRKCMHKAHCVGCNEERRLRFMLFTAPPCSRANRIFRVTS